MPISRFDAWRISFRGTDHWNPGERVQPYTHALWMFLVSGLRVFTGELFYTSLYLSFGVTLGAVLVFDLGWWRSPFNPRCSV